MAWADRTFDRSFEGVSVPDRARVVRRLRRIARLFDTAVRLPGGFRFGANTVIGLVPGFGDGVVAAVSLYFLWEAHRLGLPRHVLARMAANVAIEAAVGAVPVLGDLFDTVFKANVRNLAIVEAELARAEGRPAPRWR
jgi:hypothetical protein